MQRRNFLKTGLAGALLPTISGSTNLLAQTGSKSSGKQGGPGVRAYIGDVAYGGFAAPGVVVETGTPHRLVCWSEAQYVPFWDIDGVWVTTEWLETLGVNSPYDFEPISDKQLRYTHVEIIEAGPARAVLHWRYAVCDTLERIFHGNTTAEEFHVVYPDGITVRKVVAYPGTGDPVQGQPRMWEVGEMLLFLPKGSTPENTLGAQGMKISNIKGDSYTHKFLHGNIPLSKLKFNEVLGRFCEIYPPCRTWTEYIYHGGLVGRPEPFFVVANDQNLFPHLHCHVCGGDHPETILWQSMLLWKHYPLWHEPYYIGVQATEADLKNRPVSTSYVTVQPWVHSTAFDHPNPSIPFDAKWNPPQGTAWLMLQGVNPGNEDYPRRLAASWLHPATIETTAGRYMGFEASERAYRLEPADHQVEFTLRAAPGSPQINPVVIVETWCYGNPKITVDQQELPSESYAVSWTGQRLVVWFKREVSGSAHVTIEGWPESG
ncbi:MAG TPA: hypothetical protein VMV34_02735 [Terriglobia bacterium]|nr:hypothetical protein [Terriglobia bacterium]